MSDEARKLVGDVVKEIQTIINATDNVLLLMKDANQVLRSKTLEYAQTHPEDPNGGLDKDLYQALLDLNGFQSFSLDLTSRKKLLNSRIKELKPQYPGVINVD